jgi:NADH pyrophosphatase NudC (nudix superfamily)
MFYVAKYNNKHHNKRMFNTNDKTQTKEVRDVKWFTPDEVYAKLKNRSSEKNEMFKLVNEFVIKQPTV